MFGLIACPGVVDQQIKPIVLSYDLVEYGFYLQIICVIAAVSAATARETKDVPTELLGRKEPGTTKALVNG